MRSYRTILICLFQEASNPFDDEDESTEVEEDPKKEEEPVPKPLDGITNEKRKTLYFVTSTHTYTAVDTDELSFEPGMKIKVIEANDADQLDDGWRLGELEDGKRGVFPENFTKKIWISLAFSVCHFITTQVVLIIYYLPLISCES